MTLETFFEKFALFAEAPDAVGKMRELVLHLAFSGKLLPTAEPWPLKPLKSLATKIGSGATPAGGRESYFTKGVPLIRSMNVHFAGFEPKGLVFLSDEQAKQLANVTVQAGDVLLNITGASIGRVTIAPTEMSGARVNQHVAIIRPIKELEGQFLAKFFASPAIQRMIDEVQVGATREALTKGMIEQFEIPLPPLAEQKRIVAKVEQLMALCDRLEAQQEERTARQAELARASLARFADAPTPANLSFLFHSSYTIPPADLRKAILTLAPRGHLVERQKVEGMVAQNAKASFSSEELPYELPDGWVWKRLGELVEFIGGSQPPKSKFIYEPRDGYTRFIQIRDFKSDANLTFIPTALANRPFKEDDVMIGRYGPPVFQILRGLSGTYNVALMKAVPISKLISKDYLFYLLLEPRIQDRVIAESDRTAGQSGVRKPLLHSFIVAIPPLAEQRRIVAKVDQLMALVDQLETQLATSRASAANLLSALVAELTQA